MDCKPTGHVYRHCDCELAERVTEERAAVCAWLRTPWTPTINGPMPMSYEELADEIERGAHLSPMMVNELTDKGKP
jgi:hypothetical protein